MKSFYNLLIDSSNCENKELNFKKSLKFNKNILKFNKYLNLLQERGIKFSLYKGFDYSSENEKVSSFRQIEIKLSNEEFNKIIDIELDFLLEYNYNENILTISII